jgi:hypothetical protein
MAKKWAGFFDLSAEVRDGKTLEDVEKALYEELERIAKEPIPAEELQKVKNNFAAAEYRRLTSTFGILYQLIQAEGLGDWSEINNAGAKFQAVTAEDVQRVVRKYFTKENRAVARYTRKPGSGGSEEDPDLAGLSNEQKPMVRQFIGRIREMKDAAQLKGMLTGMQAQAAGGDPKRQQVQKILLRRIEARIAELAKKP